MHPGGSVSSLSATAVEAHEERRAGAALPARSGQEPHVLLASAARELQHVVDARVELHAQRGHADLLVVAPDARSGGLALQEDLDARPAAVLERRRCGARVLDE